MFIKLLTEQGLTIFSFFCSRAISLRILPGRIKCGRYKCLYSPSPLFTKGGMKIAEIFSK